MKIMKSVKTSIYLAVLVLFTAICFVGCDSTLSENVWVTLSKSSITLAKGQSEMLEFSFTPADAKDISYVVATNNSNVVSVTQNGKITAVGVGIATVTVTTKQGANSANCVVTVIDQPITLSAPQNIGFDGEKIVWDRVEHRTGYKVELNGIELSTVYATDFFRGFVVGVENVVRVKTIGNGSAYLSSEWSEPFTFTQLDAPTLNVSNGKITFISNSTSPKFDLYVDGELIKSNIAIGYYLIPSSLSEGEHIYKAKELGNSDFNTYTSKFSSEIVITKLYAPRNAVVSASTLSFDAVVGAQGYFMEMTEIATGISTYTSLTTNSYYLGSDYVAGKYNIKVMSIGDGVTTIDSEYSNDIALDKLDSPTNLTISNGIISWDYSAQAQNGFLVNVYDTSSTMQATQIVLSSNHFNFKEKFTRAGIYYVTIIATGDDAKDKTIRYINSAESERLYVTKLDVPSNARISQNSLVWSSVAFSEGYEVWHNSTTFTTSIPSFSFINTENYSFPVGTNSAKVRAIGNNADIIDSEYSDYIDFIKLTSLQKTDFSIINGTVVQWNSVPNCIRYSVYINDETPIEVADNKFDLGDAKYDALSYNFRVQALSSIDTYVKGEISEAFTFEKLGVPTNVGVVNGQLDWDAPSGSNIISSYRIKVGDIVYDTKSSETKNSLNNMMADGTTQPISVQAICEDKTNQIMWGNFSEPINLTKLSSNFGAKIENGKYIWEQIENADKYAIIIKYFYDGENFIENMEVASTETRSLDLVSLSLFDNPTTYSIAIQAVAQSGGLYLSSQISSAIDITRLNPVQNLHVSGGIIQWDLDENVSEYKAFVSYLDNNNAETTDIIKCQKNTTLELGTQYLAKEYTIKIQSCGDLSSTLNAIENDDSLVVTKLGRDFNISVNKNLVMWDRIDNASNYAYQLYNSENSVVSQNFALLNPQIDLTNVAWAEKYYLIVRANGDDESYLNSDWGANEGEQHFVVKLLKTPTNLSIDNGILSWDYVNNTVDYEIKITSTKQSGTTFEKTINYTKEDENERGSFDLMSYAISQKLMNQISVVIRATGGVGVDAYISSAYSDAITAFKLATPELRTESGILNWDEISNSKNYKIYIDIGLKEVVLSRDIKYYELGKEFDAGQYKIQIQALGDEKNYLSSDISSEFIVEKLDMPNDVHLDKGEIVWSSIANTDLYTIEILKQDTNGKFLFYNRYSLKDEQTNNFLFSGDYGSYKISLKCIPHTGAMYLSSSVYEYDTILIKLGAPNDMHVEEGVLAWTPSSNLTENGYILDIGGNKTSIGPVSTYSLDGRSAIQYFITITSVGDDTQFLTSDTSFPYSVYKIPETTLLVKDGQLNWDVSASSVQYEMKVYDLEDVATTIIFENLNNSTLSYDLEYFANGYYYAKIRAIAGQYSADDIGACVNSDWSTPINIYKLNQPNEFKLESDFNSSDENILQSLGTLKWSVIENAKNYTVEVGKRGTYIDETSQTVSYTSPYDTYSDITDTELYFSDEALKDVGAYVLSLTAYNDDLIVFDGKKYSAIKSDRISLNTYKLPTARELQSRNGALYWGDPDLGDEIDVEYQYLLYWRYAELDGDWESAEYNSMFIGSAMEHNIIYHGVEVIARSYSMSKMGKYQFMLRTVGQNCIRSSLAVCNLYYNYESIYTSYCVFDFFYRGTGTQLDPYVIKTFERNNIERNALEQLDYINYFPNSAFLIDGDIELGEDFVSIGAKDEISSVFNGYIEGINGDEEIATIYMQNVSFNSSGNSSVGLFSSLGESAVVQYINLKNISIQGAYSLIGALTSENYGQINHINIENMVVDGTSSSKDALYCGGMVGKNYGTIHHCQTTPILKPTSSISYTYVGGIAGYNAGIIEACKTSQALSNGEPVENQIIGTMVGGIAGYNYGAGQIKQCSNYANIYGKSSGDGAGGFSYASAGGIVGKCSIANEISDSLLPQITDSYNRGCVVAFDDKTLGASKSGGIIGTMVGGSISNCYSTGEVYVLNINGITKEYSVAGGIIGSNESNNSILINSYFVSSISQGVLPDDAAGLSGTSHDYSQVQGNYLIENALSENFTLLQNAYQILNWEVE